VLRSHTLGEADRIVTFLTRTAGKVRAVARGARRSRKRFGSNLELLSRVRLTYFEKEGVDLARVESADLLESFYALQADPERGAVLACFAEVADAFAREQQEDEAFFRLLHAVLQAVKGGLDLEWAGRYFELWTLKLHGVLPPLTQCGRCGAAMGTGGGQLLRREAIVTCRRCGDRRAGDPDLPAAAVAAAVEILKRAPAAFIGRPVDKTALAPLRALSLALLFDLTEKRFRSYDVLEQLRRTT
jgi:DNA repair protein RecO (recombination protein O)